MTDDFVERIPPAGRPEIRADARVLLSMRGRNEHGWRTDPAIGPLDKGLLAILSYFPIGQWVAVEAIISRVNEEEVEVLAAVSRMFSIDLLDVEGMTSRKPRGM